MYLAALQGVDHEQVEAAQIDRRERLQRFRHVVDRDLPGYPPELLLTTIWTFNYFDLIWVTTLGGPLKRTYFPDDYLPDRSASRQPLASVGLR
jgi:multiple sugar transport system permease protein